LKSPGTQLFATTPPTNLLISGTVVWNSAAKGSHGEPELAEDLERKTMEEIACIFCGMHSSHAVITEAGYNGRKCQPCNLIYISPRPSASEVTRIYSDNHAARYADSQLYFERFGRMCARRTLAKIKRYKQGGSILELGPGGGFFLLEAREFGYDPFGIELNPIEAQWIQDKLKVPCENVALHQGSFGGKKYDIIYHQEVLSHLYDPIQVFRDINRSLNEGGLLVFETGNIADVREKYYRLFSRFGYPDHLFYFGEKSIKELLQRTGFESVCIYRKGLLLQLLLQKLLWRYMEQLKDKGVVEDLELRKEVDPRERTISFKRWMRLLYRYISVFLVFVGAVLPKQGWPLSLMVVAVKRRNSILG
jgi:SAM-dependent methyltransferase